MPNQTLLPSVANGTRHPRGVRVVVLGAGFAGLTFCREFSHPDAFLTVVDRTNHHLFQPLLYQVAMAGLSAPDIAQPIRSILSRRPSLEVILDEIEGVNFNERFLVSLRGRIPYDYLVVAPGSVTSYFGHPEWEEFAPGLKTLDDALLIRRNVLMAFEKAEAEPHPEQQQRLMSIIVIGGGPTGVELAGACAELAHRVLRRDFDRIDPRRARILLVEGQPRILSNFPAALSESAKIQLEKLGVQVRTDCQVRDISKGCVTLDTDEELRGETILWGAGVMAHPITKVLGLETDRSGRIKVCPDLSVPGHPEVFAAGDVVFLIQKDGAPVPGVAPAAMQMARHIAGQLRRELDSRGMRSERLPFRYLDKGSLATIGRSKGVAWFGKIRFAGFFAWLSWLLVHLLFLIGFRNKFSVLMSWTYSYFTYKLGARIITGVPRQPSKSGL